MIEKKETKDAAILLPGNWAGSLVRDSELDLVQGAQQLPHMVSVSNLTKPTDKQHSNLAMSGTPTYNMYDMCQQYVTDQT